MKRLALCLLLMMPAAVTQAAVWTDSAGTAVADGQGDTRSNRGTTGASSGVSPINISNISVMSGEISKAIQDLAADFGSDGKLVATCTIPSQNFSFYECPNSSSNCNQDAKTGISSIHRYLTFHRDTGTVRRRSTSYLEAIDIDNQPLSKFLTPVPVSIPETVVTVEFSPQGYDIYLGSEKLNSNAIGDLSTFKNVEFSRSARQLSSKQVLSKASIYVPGFKLPTRSVAGDDSYADDEETFIGGSYYLANISNRTSGYKLGIRSTGATGTPHSILSVRSMEHLISGGKYSRQIVMNVETAKLKNGNRYYSYIHGFAKTGVLVEQFSVHSASSGYAQFRSDRPVALSHLYRDLPLPSTPPPFTKTVSCTLN